MIWQQCHLNLATQTLLLKWGDLNSRNQALLKTIGFNKALQPHKYGCKTVQLARNDHHARKQIASFLKIKIKYGTFLLYA